MTRLIDKIVRFENDTDNTVQAFNEIFTYCKLSQFLPTALVEIGAPEIPVTTRNVTVGGLTFKHNFDTVLESDVVRQIEPEERDEF